MHNTSSFCVWKKNLNVGIKSKTGISPIEDKNDPIIAKMKIEKVDCNKVFNNECGLWKLYGYCSLDGASEGVADSNNILLECVFSLIEYS